MNETVVKDGKDSRPCWFVGAMWGGSEDQTPRFLQEGIWENGYTDKYLNAVRSMRPGDRISIKSSYVRKHNLPFDNRGNSVSVMAIKATGTVLENTADGRLVKVQWDPPKEPREWYFYTYRTTIAQVIPGTWAADELIEFTFGNKPQDIDRFRNDPYWKERFGDNNPSDRRFLWTPFYEEFADKLLAYRNKRSELVAVIHKIAAKVEGLSIVNDKKTDGTRFPLKDICPFTTFGLFNRGTTEPNRRTIAGELARFLGVQQPVPNSFEGIPILNNQKSWFFAFSFRRQKDDIDVLWEVFFRAIALADSDEPDARLQFAKAYDAAIDRRGVKWNLSMGLYWIRPWEFLTLDSQSQYYIRQKLSLPITVSHPKGCCTAKDYLEIYDVLQGRFQEEVYPVHSFPELSLKAFQWNDSSPAVVSPPVSNEDDEVEQDTDTLPDDKPEPAPKPVYSASQILADGCFLPLGRLEQMLERLRVKKNIILQGPPGTGKTWLAKKLAFALIGQKDEAKVRAVQFHPNLSYEDFVRGWRPTGEGKLGLVDGPFMEMVESAKRTHDVRHVIVIEEINRGNPAAIFGEILTLLEADKRTPDEALELSYRKYEGERVSIPANLFVIGTMNIADRSLALVDLALRRRFAFIDLEPVMGDAWRNWVHTKCGIELSIAAEIELRIEELNQSIASDAGLGPQFRVGHSYVTPPFNTPISDAKAWFRQVVQTEIGPLLEEYWFDSLSKAEEARERLLAGF